MRFLLTLYVLLVLSVFAIADCPCSSCPGESCTDCECQGYRWVPRQDDGGCYGLFKGDVQVGFWNGHTRLYFPYDAANESWGCGRPWRQRAELGGLIKEKTYQGEGERIRINGEPASKQKALDALKRSDAAPFTTPAKQPVTDPLPDDCNRMRLTVIGPAADRQRVTTDLDTSLDLAGWKGQLSIQSYEPTSWAVARAGFVTTGRPTIYLQAPDGKVLHRQDDYQDGASGLACALRKADPNYQPAKNPDPDLRSGGLSLPLAVGDLPVKELGLMGVLLGFGLLKKRKP